MDRRIEPTVGSRVSEPDNLYRPAEAPLLEEQEPTTPAIFNFHGRLSLARYWAIHLSLVVVVPSILLVFFALGLKDRLLVLSLVALTISIPTLLLSLSLLMRRARDLGWSPAWGVLAMFLPIINLLILLPLVLIPGRDRSNRYGPPNRPLGRALRVLICISAVLTVAASPWIMLYLFAALGWPAESLLWQPAALGTL